ncbi:hypothetical protein I316_06485 [Kwoniella heveanensis BCC8398]|uniref:Uncharacterized protein n=1 Tax=Kwoniella heveanensis BCC8398 TaxID=1296120 RepID=A0A1B9GM03_9TREE|nr:hypothetical protein I316_06485 [Kwoniella heveanensis BCC8398]
MSIPSGTSQGEEAQRRSPRPAAPEMVERRIDLGLLERALSLSGNSTAEPSSAPNEHTQPSNAAFPTCIEAASDVYRARGRASPVPSYHERAPLPRTNPQAAYPSPQSQTTQTLTSAAGSGQDVENRNSAVHPPLPLKRVIRSRPAPFIVFSFLVAILLGIIVGWIVFMRTMTGVANDRRANGEGDGGGVDGLILVGNGGFVFILLLTIALILRQVLLIYALVRPPPPRDPSQPTILNIPAWLLPTPPAYSESPTAINNSTSHDQGGQRYAHTSRVVEEDDEDRVGVVVLYQPASIDNPASVPARMPALSREGGGSGQCDGSLGLGLTVEVEDEHTAAPVSVAATRPESSTTDGADRREDLDAVTSQEPIVKSTSTHGAEGKGKERDVADSQSKEQ